MSGETTITVVGNLTSDPELRFTASGIAVATFTIASTPRSFDKNANEWKDGETLFLRSTVWREVAENVAETLTKGTRVIAQGRLVQRSYEKDGQTLRTVELQIDEVGPALRYATAKVTRNTRTNNSGTNQQANNRTQGHPQNLDDPWATPNNQTPEEPPF